jgi:hypothetical protein
MKRSIKFIFNPEEHFILACCKKLLSYDLVTDIDDIDNILSGYLNWDYILSLANLHALNGLIYYALLQCDNKNSIPIDVFRKLEMRYHRDVLKNLLYIKEYAAVIRNFNRKRIKAIPLKGIEFLHSFYAHNIGIRSLSDIDILVEKKNVSCAEETLLNMGFTKIKKSVKNQHRFFHSNFWRRLDHLIIMVELHWDIDFSDSPFKINIEEFWSRSQKILIAKMISYKFSTEDNIIFNCFHLFREIKIGFDEILPLKNFCDIGMILSQAQHQIDWNCIIERSQEYKVLRPVALVLLLVQELLMVKSIPTIVIESLYEAGFQDEFRNAIKEYIFPEKYKERKIIPFFFIELSTRKTFREKMKVFFRLPQFVINLYYAKYYHNQHRSLIKSILSMIYYYIKKITKTILFFIKEYRDAIILHKNLTISSKKTEQIVDWVRGKQ